MVITIFSIIQKSFFDFIFEHDWDWLGNLTLSENYLGHFFSCAIHILEIFSLMGNLTLKIKCYNNTARKA